MINLNVNKQFRYIDLNPEDYASLSFYMRRNYKLKIINNNTVIYHDNPDGMSKKLMLTDILIKLEKQIFIFKKVYQKRINLFLYKMFTENKFIYFFKIKI